MTAITTTGLQSLLRDDRPTLILDVRRRNAYHAATELLPGALRREPEQVTEWAADLPRTARLVVYCAHGREVSQSTAAALAARGFEAFYLEGGIEGGWKAAGAELDAKAAGPGLWVTRARPKIDRIACPWLIRRHIDAEAQFLYVAPEQVLAIARERGAVPFDVPGVRFSHAGESCTFDALLAHHRLRDPALLELATIVRGADTGVLTLAPQCSGLLAISLGLSRLFADDQELLRHGMLVYDALDRWCREAKGESHAWSPSPAPG